MKVSKKSTFVNTLGTREREKERIKEETNIHAGELPDQKKKSKTQVEFIRDLRGNGDRA